MPLFKYYRLYIIAVPLDRVYYCTALEATLKYSKLAILLSSVIKYGSVSSSLFKLSTPASRAYNLLKELTKEVNYLVVS